MKLGRLLAGRRWGQWLLAGVACSLLVGLMIFGMFRYSSICTVCGAEQETIEWQIPLTSIAYWHTRWVNETPLSRAIARAGVADSHEHRWLFANGRGNGVMCALGTGGNLWEAVRSETVAGFLEAVGRYQGQDSARHWRERLLDPERSREARDQILMAEPPAAGFAGQAEFDRWWQAHAADLVAGERNGERGPASATAASGGVR